MATDLHAVRLQGEIELSDGSKTSFSIQPDLGWQQWGNYTEKLGITVPLMEELAEATADHLREVDENDEEVDDVA